MSECYRSGRYRVDGPPIHESDYSRVLLATDLAPHVRLEDQAVILKVLKTRPGAGIDHAATMFDREVSALEHLKHPGIVRMLDHFFERERNELCIVLEFLPEARSLDAAMTAEAPPPLAERLSMLLELAAAIDHAHRHNIVHRDINPSNVLIAGDQAVKLVDFGISQLRTALRRGKKGTVRRFHTPPFAPLEQYQQGLVSTGCDWYAFGMLIATTLAWEYPDEELPAGDIVRFAGDIQGALRDPDVAQRLEQLLLRLVTTPDHERPRAHEIEAVLRAALGCVQRRDTLLLSLGTRARRDLENGGLLLRQVLSDLNEHPRVKLVLAQHGAKAEDDQILVFGSRFKAVLTPSRRNSTLQLDRVWDNSEQLERHERLRSAALEAYVIFDVSPNASDASDFVDYLQRDAQRRSRQAREEARRRGFIAVAAAVLEYQRERAGRLTAAYRVPGLTGERAFVALRAGQLIDLDLVEADSEEAVTDNDLFQDFPAEAENSTSDAEFFGSEAGERSRVLMPGSAFSFASVHAFNPTSRTLTLRATRKCRLPVEGELTCVDTATLAPIQRQEQALNRFVRDEGVNPALAELVIEPERNSLAPKQARRMLQPILRDDPRMVDLVERALSARDFFLVQGPPGTGKTTVITEIMAQILHEQPNAKILLTSQANEAVNNALDRLQQLARTLEQPWRLQRDWSGDEDKGGGFRNFDAEFSEWIAQLKAKATERAAAYEPLEGEDVAAVGAALEQWTTKLTPNRAMQRTYASGVQVYGATCSRVPNLRRRFPGVFDWVILDEAAKATASEVIVALLAGKKFILVGDHKQLPPYLDRETEDSLTEAGLNPDRARTSLFEDMFERLDPGNRASLIRQYRMHPSIGELVGRLYYGDEGGLETGRSAENFPLSLAGLNGPQRVFWLDVPKGNETQSGVSWRNIQEAKAILTWLRAADLEAAAAGDRYSVAVIAAYAAQKQLLRQMLLSSGEPWTALEIQIDTVDAFQGKEADVVVYSVTRTSFGEKKFINDRRRLNVAFSRARRLLLIVGRSAALRGGKEFSKVFAALPAAGLLRQVDA